jgi:UDP-2,4-diacetamido-2,4,6-trideoxy-beta-L-altropyranose hydrolase
MIRTALFRADASTQIGGGHIRRCLVLADALRAVGWDCTFATASGSTSIVPQLLQSKHEYVEVDTDDSDTLISQVGRHGYDLLVVDHYGLDAAFERSCCKWAKRVLVIDDLANRPHDCDVLLDPTLGRAAGDYALLLARETVLLLGPNYALLEPRFFIQRLAMELQRPSVQELFVSFGMVDTFDLSGWAIEAAQAAGLRVSINIAVGSASPNVGALRAAAARAARKIHIEIDSDNIAPMMATADVAVGAGGGTSWERCCLGLPSLIITVADNQHEGAIALDRAGAARHLGPVKSVSVNRMAAEIARLADDHSGRVAMQASAFAVTDGLGAARVVSTLDDRINAKDGGAVTLRPVAVEDCEIMFAWQSAPGARRYSRNPQGPAHDEHQKWFHSKLADPRCVLNIVQHAGRPVGVLRYDWRKSERRFEVSILIASEHQGRGIGLAALKSGRRLLRKFDIIAEVDPANTASAVLFGRAGFFNIDDRHYLLPSALLASSEEVVPCLQ